MTAEAQRVWSKSTYGSSTDSKNNGVIGNANDGKVTVYSEGGKGKIVPGSTDGLTFYYTAIDPETENFTLDSRYSCRQLDAFQWTGRLRYDGCGCSWLEW